jgi:hypothetical protein
MAGERGAEQLEHKDEATDRAPQKQAATAGKPPPPIGIGQTVLGGRRIAGVVGLRAGRKRWRRIHWRHLGLLRVLRLSLWRLLRELLPAKGRLRVLRLPMLRRLVGGLLGVGLLRVRLLRGRLLRVRLLRIGLLRIGLLRVRLLRIGRLAVGRR